MTDYADRHDVDHLWCAECDEITNHTSAAHREAEAAQERHEL